MAAAAWCCRAWPGYWDLIAWGASEQCGLLGLMALALYMAGVRGVAVLAVVVVVVGVLPVGLLEGVAQTREGEYVLRCTGCWNTAPNFVALPVVDQTQTMM